MKQQCDFDEIKKKFFEELDGGKTTIVKLAKKLGVSKPAAYNWTRTRLKESKAKLEQAIIESPKLLVETPTATPQVEVVEVDDIIIEAVVNKRDELIRVLHDLNQTRGQLMKDIDTLNKYLPKK